MVACSQAGPQLEVSGAWGRPSPGSAVNAAFYLTIQNSGRASDKLVGATIAACGAVELHQSLIDENNVMRMQRMAEIEIPAGEAIKLEVGGLHLMCLNKEIELTAGDQIPLTLSFATSDNIQVEAEIRDQ